MYRHDSRTHWSLPGASRAASDSDGIGGRSRPMAALTTLHQVRFTRRHSAPPTTDSGSKRACTGGGRFLSRLSTYSMTTLRTLSCIASACQRGQGPPFHTARTGQLSVALGSGWTSSSKIDNQECLRSAVWVCVAAVHGISLEKNANDEIKFRV